jgi:UDP-N-acetylglucosamine:LPS N-acetylglucosamine transferase
MVDCQFIFFDAGGGHRCAATALSEAIGETDLQWRIHLVNLQDVLDSCDIFQKITGRHSQEIYNTILRKNWTIATPPLNRFLHAAIRLRHARMTAILEAHWRATRPDMVVSLVPHFNRAMLESLRRVSNGCPFVTILTDIADYPPHFWLEAQEQHFICGSQKAIEQGLALGIRKDQLLRTSGMIIHPRFYTPIEADRSTERGRQKLDPDLPTGLIMFGAYGSPAMVNIVDRLQHSKIALQLIVVCGHNRMLMRELEAMPTRFPMRLIGFTREVPHYMHISDFFVGKPGPGSISEALVKGLPVIVETNMKSLPQERYNAVWIEQNGVGVALKSFNGITEAVSTMLEPHNLCRFRDNVARQKNRAVFEIPSLLQTILDQQCQLQTANF